MGPHAPRLWRAPAKINLTLHVLGRDPAGWHALDSLVAFAGCCDWLSFQPEQKLSLTVDGPTATSAGDLRDNLVLRAAEALAARVPGLRLGRFALRKFLPVAAGIGGGSSDAAAALRALAYENGLAPEDDRLYGAAASVGADVPVCLAPRARLMAGRGERLGPALDMAPLFAVLANPGVALSTADVFAALGLARGAASDGAPSPRIAAHSDADQAIATIQAGRNDLEAPARRLSPAVGEALAALAQTPGARLARMSGSGATCFALFDTRHAAARAARALTGAHPSWWVRATLLR
ncbi:MAG: 4-(cytidine 5'-diphospho)-2-C-methyl-D-erythritol kinase [Bradyrhizobium sp.]|nr:MAG: 4-(cytidine 5'-diphospho)-2-C-methyl-D-erythritol kinase [Bradyrhizobium sp.]